MKEFGAGMRGGFIGKGGIVSPLGIAANLHLKHGVTRGGTRWNLLSAEWSASDGKSDGIVIGKYYSYM